MRILQISSARHFGGGERHLADLTNGLARRGHELFVAAAPDSPVLPELQSLPRENCLAVPFRKPLDVASAWQLRKFAREREIEIVHAHVARDYPLAALIARTSRPRLVLTRHVLFPMGRLHKLTRGRVARVIAVSEAVAAGLRAQKIFDDGQITVVRHGIDLSRFRRGRESRSDGYRVGILGELSPVKGQADFVRVAAIIAGQRNDVEFVIAGRDNSAGGNYGREVRQLIATLGLTGRIQIIESRVDVAEFLSQLDVLISASHSEAFGLVIVEAMAAGVAVVATATDGASEIISDGQTGRLVAVGDIAGLAARTSEILADPEQRKSLGDKARAMVMDDFCLDRMIAETEAVYHDVLSR